MAEVVNLQQVLEALAASGVETDTLLTAVGELSSVPAGGFNTPVNTLYTLESANGTPLANVINISQQAASEAAQAGNSNIAGAAAGTFTNSQGASAAAGQTAGMSSFFGGAKKFLNQTLVGTEHFGVGTVAAPIAAVAVGAKAGKWLDEQIYNLGSFFGLDMASTLDPATWDSITYDMADTGKEGVFKRGLQLLLGLNQNSGELEAYMPQDAFNYLAYVLAKAGYFDAGGNNATQPSAGTLNANTLAAYNAITQPVAYSVEPVSLLTLYNDPSAYYQRIESNFTVTGAEEVDFVAVRGHSGSYSAYVPLAISKATFTCTEIKQSTHNGTINTQTLNKTVRSINTGNGTYYYAILTAITPDDPSLTATMTPALQALNPSGDAAATDFSYYAGAAAYIINTGTKHSSSPVEGTGNQPGATIPNINSNSTAQEVADALNNTFPELVGDRVEMPVAVPGTIPKPVTYVQVPLPASVTSTSQGTEPIIKPTETPQANPGINPQTATDPLAALVLKILTSKQAVNMPDPATDPEHYPNGVPEEPVNTNPAGVGTGVTPPLVVPVGSASALWAVYNPTQAEIDALGAWLWSNNFVDQLLKMFNDPMQAIIGLHKTFIPPITGAAQDIKVGYLNSGVSALTVPTQYSTVDCGTIDCAEYFGNVFDYAPYTRVYIYLPFIGFKELDVAQIMRGKINVKYRGDAYTGCCLAEVSVTRDGESGGVLYTYSGDCAARYPLSHGSYMGIVNAIAGIGIGIGTALAGAPSIGVAGAVGMAQHARATVEHSGSFSGNSGAMGIKKPYLVIMRPQTAMANNYQHFTGQPSNSNVVLGSASGYVRVKECHVEDIATATDAEKQMIESALKTGVII